MNFKFPIKFYSIVVLLIGFSNLGHCQNVFDYTHWTGGKYRAEIWTYPGGKIEFYHTHWVSNGNVWKHVSTSQNIDYKTDDGRDYTATLRYDAGSGKFIFQHCPRGGDRGDCHEDVVIRVRDGNKGEWEISIKPQSDFGKTAVSLNKKILKNPEADPLLPEPPKPPEPPTPPKQEDPLAFIYNDLRSSNNPNSIACNDVYYKNAHKTKSIRLTVEYNGSLFDSNCSSSSKKEIKTLLISPQETKLFFTNIGGNPDVIGASFY